MRQEKNRKVKVFAALCTTKTFVNFLRCIISYDPWKVKRYFHTCRYFHTVLFPYRMIRGTKVTEEMRYTFIDIPKAAHVWKAKILADISNVLNK